MQQDLFAYKGYTAKVFTNDDSDNNRPSMLLSDYQQIAAINKVEYLGAVYGETTLLIAPPTQASKVEWRCHYGHTYTRSLTWQKQLNWRCPDCVEEDLAPITETRGFPRLFCYYDKGIKWLETTNYNMGNGYHYCGTVTGGVVSPNDTNIIRQALRPIAEYKKYVEWAINKIMTTILKAHIQITSLDISANEYFCIRYLGIGTNGRKLYGIAQSIDDCIVGSSISDVTGAMDHIMWAATTTMPLIADEYGDKRWVHFNKDAVTPLTLNKWQRR